MPRLSLEHVRLVLPSERRMGQEYNTLALLNSDLLTSSWYSSRQPFSRSAAFLRRFPSRHLRRFPSRHHLPPPAAPANFSYRQQRVHPGELSVPADFLETAAIVLEKLAGAAGGYRFRRNFLALSRRLDGAASKIHVWDGGWIF